MGQGAPRPQNLIPRLDPLRRSPHDDPSLHVAFPALLSRTWACPVKAALDYQWSPGPHRRGWLILLAFVIVVATVVAVSAVLATVPVLEMSSFGYGASGSGLLNVTFAASLCPAGARANASYAAVQAPEVHFTIYDPAGTLLWSSVSAHGSTTFIVATCGAFPLGVVEPAGGRVYVNVTLSYWSPTL